MSYIFQLRQLGLGLVNLFPQTHFLFASELSAGSPGQVERRNDSLLQLTYFLSFRSNCLFKQENFVVGGVGSFDLFLDVFQVADQAVDLLFKVTLLLFEGSKFLIGVEMQR